MFKIKNRLNTSLAIEDIGVTLTGGGESIISDHQYSSSQDVRRLSHYISVHPINTTKVVHSQVLRKEEVTQPPPPQIINNMVIKNEPDNVKESKVDALMNRLESMISSLEKTMQNASGNFQPSQSSRPEQAVDNSMPIFIPSQITPENSEVNFNAEEKKVEGNHESINALKNLRGKKPKI